jgi:hypothetical protein
VSRRSAIAFSIIQPPLNGFPSPWFAGKRTIGRSWGRSSAARAARASPGVNIFVSTGFGISRAAFAPRYDSFARSSSQRAGLAIATSSEPTRLRLRQRLALVASRGIAG